MGTEQNAWKAVSASTIKHCFEKCGFVTDCEELIKDDEDLEFEAIAKELCKDSSSSEYVDFDSEIPTSEPTINIHEIGWRIKAREEFVQKVTNPQTNDLVTTLMITQTRVIMLNRMVKKRVLTF